MALPLKVVPSTPSKTAVVSPPGVSNTPFTPHPTAGSTDANKRNSHIREPNEITSPHELTLFVENLLTELESKFDTTSNQILEKLNQMSGRVDALESSIQDIINGDISGAPVAGSVPQSPIPGTPGSMRRAGSANASSAFS